MKHQMRYIVIIIGILLMGACKDSSDTGKKVIDDLPFAKAETAKAYADLILKSIRTNRDKPIYQECMARSVWSTRHTDQGGNCW